MITQLSIKNLAVIEFISLSFDEGLHVFTGETGAGKSIVMDALSLLLGGRGSAEWIRYGTDKAEIEAMYDPPVDHPAWNWLKSREYPADCSESIIVRRELSRTGKNVCRINGQMSNLASLKELGELMVELHGQHEHQALSKSESHLGWLDAFGGTPLATSKSAYQHEYAKFLETKQTLDRVSKDDQQAIQQADLYRFQLTEILEVKPIVGEDETLETDRKRLQHSEKMIANAQGAYEALGGQKGALPQIHKAIKLIHDLIPYDEKNLKPLHEQIQSAYFQLEDASYELRDYSDGIDADPKSLDSIESRLEELRKLKRKYGVSVEDVLAYAESLKQKLNQMEHRDELIEQYQKELLIIQSRLHALGGQLRSHRAQSAEVLSNVVEAELRDLQMPRARFVIQINDRPNSNQFGPHGMEIVEFLISTNPGEPPKPLAKIASGGELSRIMLALKTIFSRLSNIGLLVFDEVDTGVSGRAAQAIAEKMATCSRTAKVFAVSHLAQTAGMADHQWIVEKKVENERTFTQVNELDQNGRVDELARMISGAQVSDKTRGHAEELLEAANQFKQRLTLIK